MPDEIITRIDADQFEAACRDPEVHAFLCEVEEYAERLIARGHCRCHLVVNCPNASGREGS